MIYAVLLGLHIGAYGFLAGVLQARDAVPELIGGTAALMMLLVVIGYLAERGRVRFSPAAILLLAAGFRLLFAFHPVSLSDDIYRYLFDGRQLLSGRNPYALPPMSVASSGAPNAALARKVNHPDLVSLYPPTAQLLFAAGAIWNSVTGMKLFLIGLDLLLILRLLRLLAALGLPQWRAIFYAWHPLSVIEIAASGHIDGAGILFVFWALSVWLHPPMTGGGSSPAARAPGFWKQRYGVSLGAGALFSIAVLVKLFPVVFLVDYFRDTGDRGRWFFTMGLVGGSLALIGPFWPDIHHALGTLARYATTWEFSGFLFRVLRDFLSSGTAARVILSVLFALVIGRSFLSDPASPLQQNPIPARIENGYRISFCFLLLTPTLHPWYGLYLVAFLPFRPEVPGILLSWSVFLGYRVLIAQAVLNEWHEDQMTALMIWAPPVATYILLWLKHRLIHRLT